MLIILRSSWALFFGVAMIFLANGLQGSLIGVRASLEGYSPFSCWINNDRLLRRLCLGRIIYP